ncbi:MAG: fluoride efflux transporter FluC [Acidimicrobiales bacterium]
MSDADPIGAPGRDLAPPEHPPAPTPATGAPHVGHDVGLSVLVAVGAGGALGTIARYEVGVAWPASLGGFPTATFTINTTGAFLLGLLLSVILSRLHHTRHVRPFIATGLLGGWTTYSTLAVEATILAKGHHLATAAAYLAATLAVGLGASVAGIALGRWGAPPVPAPIDPDLPEGSEVGP